LPVHWERIPHLRNVIRRYKRHQEGNTHVLYVRICAPRAAQVRRSKPPLYRRQTMKHPNTND
jgi:hypothetical protein